MVNLEVLKKNLTYLVGSIIVIILLLLFNNGLDKNKLFTSISLTDDDIEIGKLVINEIVTSNKGAYIDSDGNSYDYIELYNGTNEDINLLNYGLSDKDDGKVKWIFPDIIIEKKSYLVVFLTGEKRDGLYANFALKEEGGELVTLKRPNGKVLDSVRTIEMESNYSMSRNHYGAWVITNMLTPGYENNEEGRQKLLVASKPLDNNGLIISEILPSNEGNVSFNGKLYGYVEVTNESDNPINLNDYYLTNDEKALYKWRFPNEVLQPHSSYLIFTNKINDKNNASFELKNKVGEVLLTRHDGIVDRVKYEDLENGLSYIKYSDRWRQSSDISPGFPNTTEGKISSDSKYFKNNDTLLISEVMSSNTSYLAQNGNQYYDWIEIYNNSPVAINLGEYYLTTDKDDKKMYKLPDYQLAPGIHYLLIASGDTSLSNSQYNHTNFKLSSAKGLLLYKDDVLIDSLYIHNIPRGNSYGRGNESGFYYFQNPTPGYTNSDNGIRQLSINPEFSKEGGIYNDVSSLEIKIEGLGDIYYTLDGSTPSFNSIKYEGPLNIDNTTVIKAISYENQKANSEIITNTYIVNENHKIPVISISMSNSNYNMLINNPWSNITVPSYVEYYDNSSSFSLGCGMKIFGGESKGYAKKGYSLKFSKEYDHSLNFKVFDDKELVEFNDLVLRSGSQEQKYSMIRDEFVSTMAVDYSSLDAQAAKPAALYINGNYYGLYFIREKVNNNFILNNHNVGGVTNIIHPVYNRVENGTGDFYWNLISYARNHDLSTDEAYEYVSNLLDINNYIDYYVFEFILFNYDLQNIRMYSNSNINNGKIRMILYDSDYGLKNDSGPGFLDYLQSPYLSKISQDTSLIKGLFRNKQFRKRFVERVSYIMKNVWTEEHVNTVFNRLYESIRDEMQRETQRWGESYDSWEYYVDRVRTEALSKVSKIPRYTKQYFGLSQEEYNEYF